MKFWSQVDSSIVPKASYDGGRTGQTWEKRCWKFGENPLKSYLKFALHNDKFLTTWAEKWFLIIWAEVTPPPPQPRLRIKWYRGLLLHIVHKVVSLTVYCGGSNYSRDLKLHKKTMLYHKWNCPTNPASFIKLRPFRTGLPIRNAKISSKRLWLESLAWKLAVKQMSIDRFVLRKSMVGILQAPT